MRRTVRPAPGPPLLRPPPVRRLVRSAPCCRAAVPPPADPSGPPSAPSPPPPPPSPFPSSWRHGEFEDELARRRPASPLAPTRRAARPPGAHAEAEPGARQAARRRAAVEAVEQGGGPRARSRGRGRARAARRARRPRPTPPGREWLGRVVEQVVDRAREPLARAVDHGRLELGERDPRRVPACALKGPRDQLVEAHVLAVAAARRRARGRSGRRRGS